MNDSCRDFLLDAVRARRLLHPTIFTLRPVGWGVNQSGDDCEQAVIPVADTKLYGEQLAKGGCISL